ncbi:MAG: hypothetical protein HRT35_34670, partial [Algicola sp.]|nr:hypothetical protein [Algicola sp.]
MNLPANVSQVNDHWFKANRHYLVSHIEWLKLLLQRSWPDHATAENEQKIVQLQQAIALQKSTAPAPFSIDCLSSVFELTEFEKLTLLLAIADEFDSSLLKNPQGEGHLTVNFSLALAILPSPEWDALLPAATLRKWGLVNIKPDNGLTHSRLMVPESIVHFLAGISGEDANVLKLSEPLDHVRFKLSNQSEAQANAISALAVQPGNTFSSQLFFTLTGDCRQTKRDLVTKIGQLLGVNVRILSSVFIPSTIDELNDFIMNWEREILLNNYFLYIECEASPASHADKDNMIDFFIDRLKWPVIVGADQKRSFTLKDQFGFEVVNPTVEEQRYYWEQLIDDQHKPAQNIEQVAAHFDLNYRDIQMCSAQL